jgi:hypothetical protein
MVARGVMVCSSSYFQTWTTTPSSVSKVIKYYSFVIFISFCAKLILKCGGVDIPILFMSVNIMSKLE